MMTFWPKSRRRQTPVLMPIQCSTTTVANEDWCCDGGSSGVEACPYGDRSRL